MNLGTGFLRKESLLSAGIRKNRLPGKIGAAAAAVVCCFLPLAGLLVMDYYNYDGDMDRYIEHFHLHPDTFRFEILIVYTLFFTLFFLLRRLYMTGVITTALALTCSFVHYMKMALNGDPFMPNDLVMARNAGQLMEFMEDAEIPPHFAEITAAALLLLILLYPARKRLRIRNRGVMLIGIVLAGLCAGLVFNNTYSNRLLHHFNMDVNNAALQSSNYSANGFVGAFTLNVFTLYVKAPDGYSREAVEAYLDPYTDADGAEEKAVSDERSGGSGEAARPDVILILNESFFDIREVKQLNFSGNPLENYDRIRKSKNCISGKLYVSAYGGGTVRPEFEILTGMTIDGLPGGILPYSHVKAPMETYVSHYRDAGYYTLAIHPYDAKFYDRCYAYENIGFDDFYGDSELQEQFDDSIDYSPQYRVTDVSVAKMIEHYLDESEEPCFLFAITMENHQPYLEIENESCRNVTVTCSDERLSEEDLTSINTYTSNLFDADRMLAELQSFISGRKDPTMVIFYGDHKPNLGGTFTSLGTYDKDGVTLGDREGQYSTPFLIFANFTLDDEACMLDAGSDNDVSTYNLLNAAAQASGMEQTPYMRLLEDYYEILPYYNVRLGITPDSDAEYYIDAMKMITYDRIFGKNYSSVVK